ncbi:MAG: alpha-amylase family glycosyl hydrolase [Spirochaetota bacterium]|nr:alpha-amylase family glycosyl hydrolase [Spirochaetota bacterium]
MKQFRIFLSLITVILFIFSCTEPTTDTEKKDETKKIPVESITLSEESIIITSPDSIKLTAKVLPRNADNATVTWASSDETVAKVVDGTVTGVKKGEAIITATAGEKTATCTVTVKERTQNSWETSSLPGDYKLNNEFWDNASVYFVLTDRFYNGNEANDTSYGREKGNPIVKEDAGKFYGGDIAGLTAKLDYLKDLGINAIWLTAPYEQIHGFCTGGSSEFSHYPYHGYYAMDYTNMDANMGTKEEFKTFVDAAHEKGIRVVLDVVMNHPGYNTLEDAKRLFPGILKNTFTDGVTITAKNYHDYIDYKNCGTNGWDDWWGGDWIRAGLCKHYKTGSGDLKGSCGGSLPDFITESNNAVSLPAFLKKKHTAEMAEYYPTEGYSVVSFEEKENYRVRDYLIYWLSSWVREFGIDGFRCDTAKHVEKEAWKQLKIACTQALRDWKAANSDKKVDDSDFWMTGEHWGHVVGKDSYYTDGGFNSMINFSFRTVVGSALTNAASIETTYSDYASKINTDSDFNVLSYISSHDTGAQDSKGLFYSDYSLNDVNKQMIAGSLLAMCPGAIQVYYGDEAGRKNSNATFSGDLDQKNRSQMPWAENEAGYNAELPYSFDKDIHAHWSKVLNFRAAHVAIGAGSHKQVTDVTAGYAFAREKGDDKVVVVMGAAAGDVTVDVRQSELLR